VRRRFVQRNGELLEVVDGYISTPRSADVMPDIQPYKSMVTGEMIESRAQHREHLKKYGLREVGNEVKHISQRPLPDVAPQQRKELIREQVDAMRESDFRRAIKRDIDNVKWNSRSN
jgi:hypothetical protein